ncbi:MAG: LssY C-terminal domain-containing protein [Acidobacteriaceae bacterium]
MFCFLAAFPLRAQDVQSPAAPVTVTAEKASAILVPRVEAIQSLRAKFVPAEIKSRKSSYSFKIEGNDWTDTGVTLLAGDKISFSADGSISFADGRKTSPAGLALGWKDLLRQFALSNANSGALIGRIGDSTAAVPFLIGDKGDLTVHTDGHLFLRINLGTGESCTGSYKLKMKFTEKAKASATTPVDNVSKLVTPETFADIPRRVSDEQGHPGDMVNFALIGTQEQVLQAFANAGYQQTDKTPQDAVIHGLMDVLQHKTYLDMPMSTLYLFGRPQDYAFARGDAIEVAAIRHHLRVWKTDEIIDGKPLWVGSSTHDNGFETDQRNGNVTHHIDPDIDQERDFILHSFDAAGNFSSAAYVLPANPFSSGKTATGGSFHSDGRILVMELK